MLIIVERFLAISIREHSDTRVDNKPIVGH